MESDPRPKTRVGGSRLPLAGRARRFPPQALEPRQETVTTSSTSASGVVEWLSNDPIGINGGLNQYVFCANNPVNFVDPFGLCEEEGAGFMDWLHGILDVGGTFEPTPFCDLGNALLYSFQGQWGYAGVSVAGVVPYLGDAAKLGKYGIKGAKGVRAITQKQAIHALERGEDVYAGSRSAAKQLQKKATGGAIEDPAHGADYYKHFHGKDREGGHAWFGEPQP